ARFARGEYLGLHLTIGLAVSLLGLWIFAGLTEDVIHQDPITRFDLTLLDWLRTHAGPRGLGIARALSALGSAYMMLGLALGVALVLAIGWSRLYLGVHYFSDVVGGYAGGVLWLSACISGLEVSRRWRAAQPKS